ncbi:uncharacterized protein CG5098-like [Brevipalpus obovatus]|uniref:uncharacterized protein CG5098-like n=1 Tax=Brevipalpus obovatus TaxID=246614 RepID=UPI003D9DD5C8
MSRDAGWICVFCKQPPHYKSMGDLFGPYMVSIENRSSSSTPSSTAINQVQNATTTITTNNSNHFQLNHSSVSSTSGMINNNIISSSSSSSSSSSAAITTTTTTITTTAQPFMSIIPIDLNDAKNHKLIESHTSIGNTGQSSIKTNTEITSVKRKLFDFACDGSFGKKLKKQSHIDASSTSASGSTNQLEVWFHENCLVWSYGVFMAGNRIRNIDDAVNDSMNRACNKCKLKGASLGCPHKGCSFCYHYICASESGCGMDEENFLIHCPKHKVKS